MPGYCVAGTIGNKVLSGKKKIEFENKQVVSSIVHGILYVTMS